MQVGKQYIDFDTPKIMAIVNLTPDSFFDGGAYTQSSSLHQRIEEVIEQGADILDFGAYSTRPGAGFVAPEEEWKRLVPALTFMRKYHENIPISIDTFRAEIADNVRRYFGDFILNDISAGTMDRTLFPWVGKYKMPYILMHIQGTPQTMQQRPCYKNVTNEVYDFLLKKYQELKQKGAEAVIIDLGFGFGKTLQHNYKLLKSLSKFTSLKCPILVGVSRKSMIYKTLQSTPQRALNGSTVLHTLALEHGANILRVHDVKEAKETLTLVSAFQNS